MDFRKILLFIYIVFVFLTLTVVAASDNQTGDVDDFNHLHEDIYKAGDTLILHNDYKQYDNNSEGIIINKAITIDGKGHTIDACNKSRVFWIKSDNVTLKDINFANANSRNYAGGAVSGRGNNICFLNCNFTNCQAPAAGGAVALAGDNITFINSTFTDNNAVIANWARIAILNDFAENISYITVMDSRGGAIYVSGSNTTIIDSKFKNNHANFYNDYYAHNPIIINHNSFRELEGIINKTETVIFLNDDYKAYDNESIQISKSITIDGQNHILDGSNITQIFNITSDNVCLKNINFINANSDTSGGSVVFSGNNLEIINCNFTNSKTKIDGGAISIFGDTLITDSNFINNHAFGEKNSLLFTGFGGAVYVEGNLTVKNSLFTHNNASTDGGAIFQWNGSLNVTSSEFKYNTVRKNEENNVYSREDVYISDSTFNNPYSIIGIKNLTMIPLLKQPSNISGSFSELISKINESEDFLLLDKDYKYIDGDNKGILISKPLTIDGHGHSIDGSGLSRIFKITSDNVCLKNIVFKNGIAFGKYFTTFEVGGGAIYWNGSDGKIINCTFLNNSGIGEEYDSFSNDQYYYFDGGMGMVMQTSKFRPLGACYNRGGAVAWYGDNAVISDTKFIHNIVGYANHGGALYLVGKNAMINACEFYNNSAWYGQSICYRGDHLSVNASLFNNNRFINDVFDSGIVGENITVSNSIVFSNDKSIGTKYDLTEYNSWFKLLDDNKYNSLIFACSRGIDSYKTLISLVYGDYQDIIIQYSNINLLIKSEDGVYIIRYIDLNNVKITQNKDLTVYYGSTKKFSVKVYESDGSLAVGKFVMFTVGYDVYKVKTDKNGVASLKITKRPGKYSVITEYGNVKVKNIISVKSRLITSDLTKKVKKSSRFKVKVLNTKGKPYAKQKVKIKFKGKTYKIKTNSKGFAFLKIDKNIKAGKYTIKTSYYDLTNKNYIIVKK